jgi:hypothetical protein
MGTVTLPGICRFAFAERPFRHRDKTLQVQTPHMAKPSTSFEIIFFTFFSNPETGVPKIICTR